MEIRDGMVVSDIKDRTASLDVKDNFIKVDTTNFCSLQKADTTKLSSGWNEQIYVNKNLKNAHLRYFLASVALSWIKCLKLKMEYGPCYISIHTPTISPSNICLEWDGWGRLTLDDAWA